MPPTLKDLAFVDLDRELAVTRTVLAALPPEYFAWSPHPKSMNLGRLALHVADLPGWIRGTFAADVLDFATAPRPPAEVKSTEELLAHFDKNVAEMRQILAAFDMSRINDDWSMKNGAELIATRPRATVYRVWCINHMIHHRGQLCLYLRLLNVPVPTVYFNTSDNPEWIFD